MFEEVVKYLLKLYSNLCFISFAAEEKAKERSKLITFLRVNQELLFSG